MWFYKLELELGFYEPEPDFQPSNPVLIDWNWKFENSFQFLINRSRNSC